VNLKPRIQQHVKYTLARMPQTINRDWEAYLAFAFAVRDRMIEAWLRTQEAHDREDVKRVHYLSLEYLMGRTLGNSLVNLDLAAFAARLAGVANVTIRSTRRSTSSVARMGSRPSRSSA